jgi:hypothetical protein
MPHAADTLVSAERQPNHRCLRFVHLDRKGNLPNRGMADDGKSKACKNLTNVPHTNLQRSEAENYSRDPMDQRYTETAAGLRRLTLKNSS